MPSEHQTQRTALAAGQKLGHFQITTLLGIGGMGEVYRARDLRLNRDVAIKTLPQDLAGNADWLAQLEREARLASTLNHANIVSVFDVGSENGISWIVSELVKGQSLRQILSKGPLPLRRVLDFSAQIGDGLGAAHSAGLMHRDLKPENIMITPEGRIKIVDFGLAKHCYRSDAPGITLTQMADPLNLTGTPAYMSPEQIAGHPLDQRSDLFSLGVVVYEMVSGRHPFARATAIAVMNAILSEEPAELPPSVPVVLAKLLHYCFEKEPSRRVQSATDFSIALRIMADDPHVLLQPPSKRTPFAVRSLSVAAGLAIVLGAFWAGVKTPPPAPYYKGSLRRLTWDPGLTMDGAISPDGKLVAYASDRGNQKNLDIYVQQIDGGGIVPITTDPAEDSDPTFSPDGTQLAFRSERGSGGIYEAAALGGQERLVIPGGERPRFSPDGRHLLYSLNANAVTSALFVQSLAGGRPIEMTRGCTWVNRTGAWSPDSLHVLFTGTCGGRTDFWLGSVSGSAPTQAKGSMGFWQSRNLLSEGMNPAVDEWLSNPSRLLVPLREHDASFEGILSIKPDGRLSGPVQHLTFGPVRTNRASGSTGGRFVLSSFEQSSSIWRLNVSSSGHALGVPVRITTGPAESVMPALSRDGKRLAFVTRLPGRWALEVTNLQSESQRTVAWERMSLRYPNFGPTDDNIIYSNSSQSKKLAISGGLGESLPFNNVTDSSPRGDLLAQPDDYHSIDIVDGTTGKLIQFVADSQTALYQAHFSLDGRWVTFNSTRNDHSQLFVVPFRKGLVPKNEWIAVTDGTVWDDKPRFTSNERFLIFTSDRDGFRCIWAEQLGPDMHPNGKPYPLYHLHAPKRSVDGATGGGLELAVAPGVVVFNQGERTGNIWLLDTH